MNNQSLPLFYTSPSESWPFIVELPSAICLYHCQYDIEYYHDELFQTLDIPIPPLIAQAQAKRKAEHLAGRICAKNALAHFGILALPILQPDNSPLWPSGIIGSITHSHNIAAAIVADTKNWLTIGLDIEQLLSETRSYKLAPRIMNEKELKLIKQDIALSITLAFSLKESLFKALFPITKKYFYFHDAEIIDWNTSGEVTLRLSVDLSSEWQKGTVIKGSYCLKENYIWSMVSIRNNL